MPNERKVVVTGMGVVASVGTGLDEFWRGLVSGRNGIARLTRFDPTGYPSTMASEVRDFDPERWIDRKSAGRMDRFTQFAVAAADMAMADSGLQGFPFVAPRAGVIIGSGIGGSETIEGGHARMDRRGPGSLDPFFVSKVLVNMAACQVSIRFGLKGPLSAPSVACSTGANAIGDALQTIQRGDADVMLAGGSEACLTPLSYGGFCANRSMSRRNDDPEGASRPFDKGRDGFVMGEGAGVIVLESLDHARGRGARIYAEAAGYGNTADAYHLTAPDPAGDGMIRVMRRALDDAGLKPEGVGHINAHGTSTVLNDSRESAAIQAVFGPHARRLKVSSIKSMIGHLMAAAGAVEFIATVMSVSTGIVPPTINYREPDPECPLDYVPGRAEHLDLKAALSNSFGFGGGNACLAVTKIGGEQ
ncbi:MAG: beta-ketoacyl-[acyl-carrier-protein] synthase II [Candidatus Aminicenantes bacterium RBG_19FT_COMBO_65_30]|nr:MAG: beta-ketoacyl-[acyl-carrier-protein] synthase II [Candidatus Aminicenantes bacterium RBG_19FT_COMBO_65_30]